MASWFYQERERASRPLASGYGTLSLLPPSAVRANQIPGVEKQIPHLQGESITVTQQRALDMKRHDSLGTIIVGLLQIPRVDPTLFSK